MPGAQRDGLMIPHDVVGDEGLQEAADIRHRVVERRSSRATSLSGGLARRRREQAKGEVAVQLVGSRSYGTCASSRSLKRAVQRESMRWSTA